MNLIVAISIAGVAILLLIGSVIVAFKDFRDALDERRENRALAKEYEAVVKLWEEQERGQQP